MLEFGRLSIVGGVQGSTRHGFKYLETDHANGRPSCMAMGKLPLVYSKYKKNTYYFQYRIEKNLDQSPDQAFVTPKPKGVKMSLGFCKSNFDLDKFAIIENKKRLFYVLDLFDGEVYSSYVPGLFNKYIPDDELPGEDDVIGCQIDMESGVISFYKNGKSLGPAFNEGPMLSKMKLYPFIQIYKCQVSIFQPYSNVIVDYHPRRHSMPDPMAQSFNSQREPELGSMQLVEERLYAGSEVGRPRSMTQSRRPKKKLSIKKQFKVMEQIEKL